MKITNHRALPQPFVDAVMPRKPSPDVIRVTELIGPALVRQLQLACWDELVEDVSDRIWSLFGQSVHGVLEAATTEDVHLVEQELSIVVDGQEIRGRPDLVTTEQDTLTDYKVTSVWSVVLGDRIEWEAQLNIYAYMLRQAGTRITHLENVCILRDWSRREAQRSTGDYPAVQVVTLRHRCWSDGECLTYIRQRLALHRDCAEEYFPCSPEERWERPTTYAVMLAGQKRAKRVLPTLEAAETFLADNPGLRAPAIEIREGASVRCEDYCPVRAVCPFRARFVTTGGGDVGATD